MKQFNSVYFLSFLACFLVCLPFAIWLNGEKGGLYRVERKNFEQETAMQLLNRVQAASAGDPARLTGKLRDAAQSPELSENGFKFLSGAVYRFVENITSEQSYSFELDGSYAPNLFDQPPKDIKITKEEYKRSSRPGDVTSQYWIPVTSGNSSSRMVMISLRDMDLQGFVSARRAMFALMSLMVFSLFYCLIAAAIYVSVKKPMSRLQKALEEGGETIDSLSPDEFGDFGNVVDALHRYADRVRSSVAAAENVDPVTGLTSGQAALNAYVSAHERGDEIFAIFIRANFAKEYVKSFGRAYRDQILKLTAGAATVGLPPRMPLFAVQDHFFMGFLTEPAFQKSYPLIQKYFKKAVHPLFQKDESGKTPMLTLSAVGMSNRSAGYEIFHDVLQKLHDDWDKLVDRQAGGWALLNSDDEWIKGASEDMGGEAEDDIAPEEPEALKDPAFERKVFIVKLAFMFNFDPRKAVKLHKLGFTRLPSFLDDGALDIVKKYGPEAENDVKQLIDKMRLIPKSRLYFTESDFKQVFITDVRIVRKIPREVVGRWFAAGLRRLEDLADMEADDLLKIDATANREDVEAVITYACRLPAPAKPA